MYIVRSKINPSLILCTNNQFMHKSLVGPGGYKAKLYKSEIKASRVMNGQVKVEKYEKA